MWPDLRDKWTTMLCKKHLASCGEGLRARNPGFYNLGKGAELHVGNRVLIERGVNFSMADKARIEIGDDSYLGDGCILLATREITIGKGCAISWHVCFMDTSSHPVGPKGGPLETIIAPIHIGNHVWIGCRACILKGVTVGDGAIIANNANVTRDVPPGVLVGGNPARVIKENVDWL